MQILKDCVATFKSVSSTKQRKSKVSVLQLQFFRKSNRVKEHQILVEQLLKDYGSMHKASLETGVPYKSLHRLCQPPVMRKREMKQVWTNIHSFYTSNIISHELPSVKSKGRRFLNLTLEEYFSMYREGCVRVGKANIKVRYSRQGYFVLFSYSVSVDCIRNLFSKLIRHPIGNAFVNNVKISD